MTAEVCSFANIISQVLLSAFMKFYSIAEMLCQGQIRGIGG